jgi:hypothetical protein
MSTGGSSTSRWTLRTAYAEVEGWIAAPRASDDRNAGPWAVGPAERRRPAGRRSLEHATAVVDS